MGQLPIVRAGLDDLRGLFSISRHRFDPADKLKGEQFAKERPNADAGHEISAPPDLCVCPAVIAMHWIVKRALHEFSERQRAVLLNLLVQLLSKQIHRANGTSALAVSERQKSRTPWLPDRRSHLALDPTILSFL